MNKETEEALDKQKKQNDRRSLNFNNIESLGWKGFQLWSLFVRIVLDWAGGLPFCSSPPKSPTHMPVSFWYFKQTNIF